MALPEKNHILKHLLLRKCRHHPPQTRQLRKPELEWKYITDLFSFKKKSQKIHTPVLECPFSVFW